MKKVLILGIALVSFIIVRAADCENVSNAETPVVTEISGTVVDILNGEYLTGVAVEFNGKVIYTDFDGNFSFKNVIPGKYELKTSLVSYKDEVIVLNAVKAENKLEIKLMPVQE